MTEVMLVKYDPARKAHTPMQDGDTIPASVAPVRVGQTDYYPEAHIAPPLLPGKRVWLNDPQPFVYDKKNDRYVLWYLYNEDSDTENGTAWREILTKDFVTFTDNGIRIPKYTTPYGDIWSGSPYIDEENLFGFGAGAVLYYVTMPCDKAGPGSQSVALWVSPLGLGYDPEFVDIVIPNPDGGAFRDPKVFLGDDKRTLYLLIAVAGGVSCFSSLDGKTWQFVSTVPLDGLGTIECPDFITIDGQQILLFSANGFEQAPTTTQTMFLLVSFDHGHFTITQDRPANIKDMAIDTGPDFYAGRTGRTQTGDNIMLAWANNWNYAYNLPTADFSGTLALPRLLDLHTFGSGYKAVVSTPVQNQPKQYAQTTSQTGISLLGDYSDIPFLDVPESSRVDFKIRPDASKGWPSNFGIFIGSGDVKSFSTAISMTGDGTGTGGAYFENTRNDFGARPTGSIKEWNEYYRCYLKDTLSEIDVSIIVDRGTAEVFVNGVYSQTFLVLWPIGAQILRLSIPEGYTLSADCTLYFNRRPGRVNGAFTRAHADSIYMFNTVKVITSYDGDENNPHTHRIRQISYDDRRGPFFQTEYGGPFQNFWQIDPQYLDLLVYTIDNEFVSPVKQIFVDKDPNKGIGVKTSYGSDTIYLSSKGDYKVLQQAVNANSLQITSVQATLQTSINNVASDLATTKTSVANISDRVTQNSSRISANTDSITNVQDHMQTEFGLMGKQITDLSGTVSDNSLRLTDLYDRVASGIQGGSPNTVGNPALMDRYPLQQADVLKFLVQAAEQKAQGLAYAGKYALTPQNFPVDSSGRLITIPYGNPPTDGKSTTGLGSIGVPIITDSCSQFYDASTGIHYRWDQFQHSSKEYPGQHWDLDGPVVSVSLDGLKWVTIRTLMYGQTGMGVWTGFWVDRDNRLGQGAGTLLVTNTGSSYVLPNLVAAGGTRIAGGPSSEGDHRVYWDPEVFNAFAVLGVDGGNSYLKVWTGGNMNNINHAFDIRQPVFGDGRLECPSWVPMFDKANNTKRQVLCAAIQRSGNNLYESMVLGAGTYNTGGYTLTSDLRYVEWGADAYAPILVDPMQQDGTGGTRNGCDVAVLNVGSYHWDYINGEAAVPSFGFGGGQHLPADVVLNNGIVYLLPSAKFKSACAGPQFFEVGIPQGTAAVNPNWTLGITKRNEVWRAQMDVPNCTFTGTSTVRFHFGSRTMDYIFGNGIVTINNSNSGSIVLHNGGRQMPLTRSFVTNSENSFVWEYDNGRIRLYNTATGEIMSDKIFPDGYQLSTVEVLGNDFFVGGFAFRVNQDVGTQY